MVLVGNYFLRILSYLLDFDTVDVVSFDTKYFLKSIVKYKL